VKKVQRRRYGLAPNPIAEGKDSPESADSLGDKSQRAIYCRCRDWIFELESTDDECELVRLVHNIVENVRVSTEVAKRLFQVEAEMRRAEFRPPTGLLKGATEEERAIYICLLRRHVINREARDHILAACHGGPVFFSISGCLRTQ
jgi:hypothetical protein